MILIAFSGFLYFFSEQESKLDYFENSFCSPNFIFLVFKKPLL